MDCKRFSKLIIRSEKIELNLIFISAENEKTQGVLLEVKVRRVFTSFYWCLLFSRTFVTNWTLVYKLPLLKFLLRFWLHDEILLDIVMNTQYPLKLLLLLLFLYAYSVVVKQGYYFIL